MKVRCINDTGWVCDKKFLFFWMRGATTNGPSIDDILTVTDECWKEGVRYYFLLEWPGIDNDESFEADCFVPLEIQYEKVSAEQIKEVASVN